MEKGVYTYVISIISILIEIVFIITALLALNTILKYEKINNTKNILSTSTKFFLIFSIIGEISYSFFSFNSIGKIIYSLFLIYELIYLLKIIRITLENTKAKIFLKSTLIILILPFSLYPFNMWFEININIFLSIESILIGAACFIYFDELKNKIASVFLENDIKTLIMVGLFFCYSTPLAFNSTIAYLSFKFPDLINTLSKNELTLYLLVSRIGTICYILFHYFIINAFKWNTKLQTGI